MSIIHHKFFPRSMFDMDLWTMPRSHVWEPSTLDLFDPFDDLDRLMGRNFLWLNKPDLSLLAAPHLLMPRVPNKYRINVDARGYSPKSIKIDVSEDKTKLIVSGSEGQPSDQEDFNHRQFRRSYKLPKNVELDKMASFMTSSGTLVIEIPIKEEENVMNKLRMEESELLPRIVDAENGQGKQVTLSLPIPEGLDPSKIKVTCKDRDVIVQAEDKQESSDGVSQTYFYRRSTLPENTNFDSIKCVFDGGKKLTIQAPLNLDYQNTHRTIPVEFTKQPAINTASSAKNES